MRLAGPVAALPLVLLCTDPALAQQRATPPPRVETVRFAGVRALDTDTLRAVVATRGAECRSPLLAPACLLGDWTWAEQPYRLSPEILERDVEAVEAFYASRGYPRAEVETRLIPRGGDEVAVEFRVREGAPQLVRSVEVRGREALPPEVGLPPLPLSPGVPYSLPRLEEAQRRIVRRLAEAGHPFAQVEVGGDTAEVVLEIVPGPPGVFAAPEIAATGRLSREAVERRLAFRPGERFDPAALERTVERLYALPLVENVSVTLAPAADAEDAVTPRIAVETGKVQAIESDLSFGSSECLGGGVRWARRHLGGEPRVISLSVGGSNLLADLFSGSLCTGALPGFDEPDYFLRAQWQEPIGPDTWLTAMAAYERASVLRAYVRRGVRGRLAVAHDFGEGWRGEIGYAPAWSDLGAVRPLYCVLLRSCVGPLPGELDGTTLIAPLEISVGWAPREARRFGLGPLDVPPWMLPVLPRWLYSARVELSLAGAPILSEFDYARVTAEGTATRLLGRRSEVAVRIRTGALASGATLAPPQLRFYGGGPAGVRGVASGLLGPEYLLLRGQSSACERVPLGCEGAVVEPDDVLRRPLGGEILLETSLEARRWITSWAQAAVFVDAGGIVGEQDRAPSGVVDSEWLVSPGVGLLVVSPLGPLRVDVAYQPGLEERLPLVATDPDGDGHVYLGRVGVERPEGGWEELKRHLRVHLYMGLPF